MRRHHSKSYRNKKTNMKEYCDKVYINKLDMLYETNTFQ